MTIEEQFTLARTHIKAGRYDDARALLKQIDHPRAQEWLAKLDQLAASKPPAQSATPSPATPNAAISFTCSVCGRSAGRELLQCDNRSAGSCPYQAEKGRAQPGGSGVALHGCLSTLAILFSVLMFGLIVDSFIDMIQHSHLVNLIGILFLLVFLAGGLFVTVLSLSFLFSIQERVFNPAAGHLWERHTILGYETLHFVIAGREPVTIDLPQLERLTLPASIGALNLEFVQQRAPIQGLSGISYALDLSVYIVTMILFHLIAQDYITLWRVHMADYQKQEPLTDGSQFVLSAGPCAGKQELTGNLEQRIMQAVINYSGHINRFNRPEIKQGATETGALFNARELKSLAYEIYNLRFLNSQYYDNIIRQALQDAADHGIAERNLMRHFFGVQLTDNGVVQIQHNNKLLREAHNHLQALNPQLLEGVKKQIRHGLEQHRELRGDP